MITESALERKDVKALAEAFPQAILEGDIVRGECVLSVAPAQVVPIVRVLKETQGYERLSAVTCVDWHPAEPRFEVVYQLHSLKHNQRMRLKVRVGGEKPTLESATGLYPSANWYEREVFDLFGVNFSGHPEMKRLLMPEYWEGHPLRKDFPTHGHKYDY